MSEGNISLSSNLGPHCYCTTPAHLGFEKNLCLSDNCKVTRKNPNRSNIFLDREKRLSNNHGYDSYSAILKTIAEDLLNQGTHYPITIIYMKLKYCGFAYSLFNKTLQEKEYDCSEKTPSSRLFAQLHSPQTRKMKQEIITELKKEHSRIRVIFATTALGMDVDAPYVFDEMITLKFQHFITPLKN